MSQWTDEDTEWVLQKITVMANTDEEYRILLSEHSTKAIKQETEKEIPYNLNL